jgi:hypothetical protein
MTQRFWTRFFFHSSDEDSKSGSTIHPMFIIFEGQFLTCSFYFTGKPIFRSMFKTNLLIGILTILPLIFPACSRKTASVSPDPEPAVLPGTRDAKKWPFSQNSIWNMPIGDSAKYLHANLQQALEQGMTIDEDIIIMKEDAPVTGIYRNNAGWDRNKDRCIVEGELLFSAPIPGDFIVSKETWDGLTPNSGLAVLMPDGRTIKQTQPFARCTAGEPATSRYLFEDQDLYGQGMYGAHGASKLSAVGGALRIGELRPGSGPVQHALKVNVYAAKNLFYDQETKGYRWPAKSADSYASGNYGSRREIPAVKECRMGALLALPASWNLDIMGFETEPARILAETFQKYGAYVVDDTAWDVYAIITEWGPDGRFNNQFMEDWGFSMKQPGKDHAWSRDMDRIFLNLHIVDNNSPSSKGGGGKPLVPLAPPFTE